MSYWNGHAPNYSTAVEAACKAVREAEGEALDALKKDYPKGAEVRVVHSRGEFYGLVIGWDIHGYRVHVKNVASRKTSKWWAACVDTPTRLTPPTPAGGGRVVMGALNYDPADPDKMKLPASATCGDCVHIGRCKAIYGHVESDTTCDWSPSRYVPAIEPSAETAVAA